jgi:hypothetical protein
MWLVSVLSIDKEKKSFELVIEKSVELFGFTPEEKSNENVRWMRSNGYDIKQVQKSARGKHRR